jgi:hypothetical protein
MSLPPLRIRTQGNDSCFCSEYGLTSSITIPGFFSKMPLPADALINWRGGFWDMYPKIYPRHEIWNQESILVSVYLDCQVSQFVSRKPKHMATRMATHGLCFSSRPVPFCSAQELLQSPHTPAFAHSYLLASVCSGVIDWGREELKSEVPMASEQSRCLDSPDSR